MTDRNAVARRGILAAAAVLFIATGCAPLSHAPHLCHLPAAPGIPVLEECRDNGKATSARRGAQGSEQPAPTEQPTATEQPDTEEPSSPDTTEQSGGGSRSGLDDGSNPGRGNQNDKGRSGGTDNPNAAGRD